MRGNGGSLAGRSLWVRPTDAELIFHRPTIGAKTQALMLDRTSPSAGDILAPAFGWDCPPTRQYAAITTLDEQAFRYCKAF
jgi:hypothetical protein